MTASFADLHAAATTDVNIAEQGGANIRADTPSPPRRPEHHLSGGQNPCRLSAQLGATTGDHTQSLVYAAAGLLRGPPATTHWRSLDLLQELDLSIDVRREERFVDDGDLITSAGISAGIDMALHLVDRLAGTDHARQVRRGIQYDPAPPV